MTTQEKKEPDWYDRVSKAGLLIVGILALFQDRQSWFPYVFLFVVFLLSLPLLKRLIGGWQIKAVKVKVVRQYASDFLSYVKDSSKFIQDSGVHSIAYNLRGILGKLNPGLGSFSSSVENFFSASLSHLQCRVQYGFKSWKDFDEANKEFSSIMSSLVMVYVEQISGELNKAENRAKLSDQEVAEIKKRQDSFLHFIEDYNSFRSRIASFSKQTQPTHLIRTPYQAVR